MAERRDDEPVGGARRTGRRTPGVLEIGPLSARRPGAAGTGRGGISEARAYTPRGRTVRETGLDRPTDPDRPALRLVDGGPADPSAARRTRTPGPRRATRFDGANRDDRHDGYDRTDDYDRGDDFDDDRDDGTMILTTSRTSCRPPAVGRVRRRRSRRATCPAVRRMARSGPTRRGRAPATASPGRHRDGSRADSRAVAARRPERRATAGRGEYGRRCVRSGRPSACASEPWSRC